MTLAFLPPPGGAPQPPVPERPQGSPAGFVIAVVLVVAGMLLPWLRPQTERTAANARGPQATISGSRSSGR